MIDQKMIAALKSAFEADTGLIKSAIALDKDFDLVFESFKNDNYFYLDDVYNENDLYTFLVQEMRYPEGDRNSVIKKFINGRRFKYTYNGFIMAD